MGDLWRSQEMEYVQLLLASEAAHDTIDELGKLGLVEFEDANEKEAPMNRKFSGDVKRAEERESKVVFLENLILKYNEEVDIYSKIPIPEYNEETDVSGDDLNMDDLEEMLKEECERAQETRKNEENLSKTNNERIEKKHVLEKAEQFFVEAQQYHPDDEDDSDRPLALGEDNNTSLSSSVKLDYITGVILREKFAIFERILFRATRGNLYMRHAEIEEELRDPHTRALTQKNVFIVFFQGEKLHTKIKKICDSFSANLYPCPVTSQERGMVLKEIVRRIDEHKNLISAADDIKRKHYPTLANKLNCWKTKILKEKAIYHTMNMFNFDLGRKHLSANAWIPKNRREDVQRALNEGKRRSGSNVTVLTDAIPTNQTPPTYFPVNKVTMAFQEIINAYGVPRYREINPTTFTLATFPFLFGVMFGDVGHGFMLLAAALFLVYKEKEWMGKQLNELIQMPFDGRYVLVPMAVFAIYCGAIYNEFFSVPMNIFGSQWELLPHATQFTQANNTGVYPFGVDPVWKGASNELPYYNSLKMKMSIILGVSHMVLGIGLKFLNSIYFRRELDLIFECIPQLLLLLCLFGYLIFLIFIKWSYPWYENDRLYGNKQPLGPKNCGDKCLTSEAPLLLSVMIYMFLSPFSIPDDVTPLYAGQGLAQGILLIIAFICVPLMLIPKPLILRARNKNSYATIGDDDDEEKGKSHGHSGHGGGDHDDEEFNFGDVFVHQIIETIEFVLGSVSNTASYLRLWALSLAHSELSTVFWNMGFASLGLGTNGLGVVILYGAWLGATVGILLVMETLSAFLHALRLHWVEYCNKFYKGDGRRFMPFTYENLMTPAVDEQ